MSRTMRTMTLLALVLLGITLLPGQGRVLAATTSDGPARLVVPITLPTRGSDPANFTVVGDTTYFFANDKQGRGLWRTDGTEAGTRQVKSFGAMPNGAFSSRIVSFNGSLYTVVGFYNNFQLWRSDGTEAGTVAVTTLTMSVLPGLVAAGNNLFIISNDPTIAGTLDLWRSDGTAAGTTRLLPPSFAPSAAVLETLAIGNELFFIFRRNNGPVELWRSDGIAAGTRQVLARGPDTPTEQTTISGLANRGGQLAFFVATTRGPQSPTQRAELWLLPPGASQPTRRWATPSDQNYCMSFMWVGDSFYFRCGLSVGGSPSTITLWRTDGNLNTSLVKRFNLAANEEFSPRLLAGQSQVYFFVDKGFGNSWDFWRSDGTTSGTTLVTTIPGELSGPQKVLGNTLFFSVLRYLPPDGQAVTNTWQSDGTVEGTRVNSAIGAVNSVTVAGSFLLFAGVDGELWRSDRTGNNAQRVKQINSQLYLPDSGLTRAAPASPVAGGRLLYFQNRDAAGKTGFWSTDGSTSGTVKLVDGAVCAQPVPSGDSVLFVHADIYLNCYPFSSSPPELWRSNGSTAGTSLVSPNTSALLKARSTLYLLRNRTEIWTSNGSTQGVFLSRLPGDNLITPTGMQLWGEINGVLLFQSSVSLGRVWSSTLWRSDGSAAGSYKLKDVSVREAVPTENLLFLVDDKGDLWVSDGMVEGTSRLASFPKQAGQAFNLTAVGSTLFFTVDDGVNGVELWRSDGTAAGTGLVKDINPGPASSFPSSLVNLNGTLYFAADDGVHGRELWRSDGTAAGTQLVNDINPGPNSSNPTALASIHDHLFFAADGGMSGSEPWVSDGTAAGTMQIQEIRPGSAGVNPAEFTATSDALYFTVDGAETGRELWQLPTPDQAAITAQTLPRVGATSGGIATLPLSLKNLGLQGASGLTLTLTLGEGVRYEGDTIGVTPTVVGQRVVWMLPNIASFAGRSDRIFIRLPEAPLGTEYSAKLTITTSDGEMAMSSTLAVVNQLYLPLVAAR